MLSKHRSIRLELLEDRTLLSAYPVVIADLNFGGDSNPQHMVTIGNTTYFTADDGIYGRELWKTDGTGDGVGLRAQLLRRPPLLLRRSASRVGRRDFAAVAK